jgi:tellurite methyltransferase
LFFSLEPMNDSQQRWEKRHREAASHPPPEPSPFLVESFPLLPAPHTRSRALDLACGAGHNAVWLAKHGWPVIAVDFTAAALSRAAAHAAACQVRAERGALRPLPRQFSGMLLVDADLESAALPASAFHLILCFQYLDRAALPRIERALAPGGFLLYESFTEAQRQFAEGPRDPKHLFGSGELRDAFRSLEPLFYREWTAGRAMASLIARKPDGSSAGSATKRTEG